MNKTESALKLALEALEDYVEEYGPHEKDSGAAYVMTAIKEALANAHTSDTSQERVDEIAKNRHEQEPVAWMQNTTAGLYVIDHYDEWHCIPLYTTSPQEQQSCDKRKPLTDEEIDRVTDQQWANNNHKPIYAAHRAYARAIEAKLKEKNI